MTSRYVTLGGFAGNNLTPESSPPLSALAEFTPHPEVPFPTESEPPAVHTHRFALQLPARGGARGRLEDVRRAPRGPQSPLGSACLEPPWKQQQLGVQAQPSHSRGRKEQRLEPQLHTEPTVG